MLRFQAHNVVLRHLISDRLFFKSEEKRHVWFSATTIPILLIYSEIIVIIDAIRKKKLNFERLI